MTKRFVGYHEESALPFRQRQTVVIPKGVTVKTMHPSRNEYVTKRSQKVKINHFCSGQSISYYMMGDRERRYWGDHPDVVDLLASLDDENEILRNYEGEDRHERAMALHKARIPTQNPKVVWPGSGGYWNEVDINDILEANGVE